MVPTLLINIPLIIAWVAFSIAATILFSPIIAIVHGISRLFTKQNYNEALNLQGDSKEGEKKSLREYLLEKNMDIEELNITLKQLKKKSVQKNSSDTLSKTNRYQLMFWRKATGPSSGLTCEECLNGGDCDDNHHAPPFSVKISTDDSGTVKKQAQNIHALFKLNIGDAMTNIEMLRKKEKFWHVWHFGENNSSLPPTLRHGMMTIF